MGQTMYMKMEFEIVPRLPLAAVIVLAVAVSLGACEGNAIKTSPKAAVATPMNCGDPAVLMSYPRDKSWQGLRLGPLFFSAFGPGKDHAVISDFDPRFPTKVVIQPTDPLNSPLKVEGRRCSNGERLRFEYGASWDTPVAVLPPAGAGTRWDASGIHRLHAFQHPESG